MHWPAHKAGRIRFGYLGAVDGLASLLRISLPPCCTLPTTACPPVSMLTLSTRTTRCPLPRYRFRRSICAAKVRASLFGALSAASCWHLFSTWFSRVPSSSSLGEWPPSGTETAFPLHRGGHAIQGTRARSRFSDYEKNAPSMKRPPADLLHKPLIYNDFQLKQSAYKT